MPALTLHHGEAERTFEEHPIEVARKALLDAAETEGSDWAGVMLRFASALPHRGAILRGDE
jgi:hypothetical protein